MRWRLGGLCVLAACGSASQIVLTAGVDVASGGGVCTITPMTVGPIPPPSAHQLELDPAINPAPAFDLYVEAVNNYPSMPLNDGDCGNCNQSPYTLQIQTAALHFADAEGHLTPSPTTVTMSGAVRSGPYSASVVEIPAATNTLANTWLQTFQSHGLTAEHLTLTVSLTGTLTSGAVVTSETLQVPLEVCFDCGGVSPTNACPTGTVLAPNGEGPCCAAQDFTDTCAPCGDLNDPCCSNGTDGGIGLCNTGFACAGTAPLGSTCGYPNSVPATCIAEP